jgi:hypothetical protein
MWLPLKSSKQWSSPSHKTFNIKENVCRKPCKREESFTSATTWTASNLSLVFARRRSPKIKRGVTPRGESIDFSVEMIEEKYGYEDAGPDEEANKCRHGDGSTRSSSRPARARRRSNTKQSGGQRRELGGEIEDKKSGYGYASPDDKAKYGHGDSSTRVSSSTSRVPRRRSLKQEGASPRASIQFGSGENENKYEYGDVIPDDNKTKYGDRDALCKMSYFPSQAPPRRSSIMKQGGSWRRASIQFGGEIEVDLSDKNRAVKIRASITFDETVTIKEVTPVSQLTDQPEALWFQAEEYNRIRKKSYAVADRVKDGRVIGERKLCVRGLERLMVSHAYERRRRKLLSWDSVLNEQDLQRKDGFFDDDYIRNVYNLTTLVSKQEAAEWAKQDAAEIENYLRSTRKMCLRLLI